MCAILVCFIALKHFAVCTGKIQRRHQTDYSHSKSQHLRLLDSPQRILSERHIYPSIISLCATQFNWYFSNCHNAKFKKAVGKLKYIRLTELVFC